MEQETAFQKKTVNAELVGFNTDNGTYRHAFDCYLKDTNAYGNMYFSRYFEWQGVCREAWFCNRIVPNMLTLEGILITKDANLEYLDEILPFNKIQVSLNTDRIRKTSFKLIFHYQNEKGILVAKGSQTIIFASKTRKIIKIPLELIKKIKQYEISGLAPIIFNSLSLN
jgi:enediyne core biosynthesis thioesterase